MQKAIRHVLIIGGGIGGPALALFLQRAGISSAIYEAYPYKEGIGGGINVAPNGMHILKSLGLADLAIKRGTPAACKILKNGKGKFLNKYEIEGRGNPLPGVSMTRSTLYEICANEMKEKGIPAYYGKKLISITETPDKVVAHFEDGSTAEGDLLVGADGLNSVVRKHILPNGPQPSYVGIVAVWGFVPLTDLPSLSKDDIGNLNFHFGPRGFFGYGGGDAGTLMWWTNIVREKEYTREELVNPDWNAVKEEVLETFKDYSPIISEIVKANKILIRHNIKDIQSLPTWHKNRIVLIGDAAHAVSPNSGQGASMALEDAMMLAKLLRDNEDHNQAFEQFEKSRKERVEKIVAEGRSRAAYKGEISPFKQKIRELTFMAFARLVAKRQQWMYNYQLDWDK